jgi:hypothetical protein
MPYITHPQAAGRDWWENGTKCVSVGSVTIADDEVLLIEIFEKNGGRMETLQIENSDLIKARLINMHLKF